jgi:carbon storage regulator
MLVLTRKKDQSIVIGDDIKITIVDIRGDKVRLGIDAPRSVPVHRKEVWIAIKNEVGENAISGGNPISSEEVAKQEP